MSNKYDWDLIERLLHEVQNSADKPSAPGEYVEQHAAAQAAVGGNSEDLGALKTRAADLQTLLLERGFIESRPENEGGNGQNFILTPRGSGLLAMIDSSIPGNDHPRQVLNEQADALDPATFDEASSQAQVAFGVI